MDDELLLEVRQQFQVLLLLEKKWLIILSRVYLESTMIQQVHNIIFFCLQSLSVAVDETVSTITHVTAYNLLVYIQTDIVKN